MPAAKLDDAMVAAIAAAVRAGNHRTTSAAVSGVSARVLRIWLTRGREELAAGEETVYARLVTALEAAEGESEVALVRMAWDVAKDYKCGHDARMLQWLLERRHAQRWGQRSTLAEAESTDAQPTLDAIRSQPTAELLRKLNVAAELMER